MLCVTFLLALLLAAVLCCALAVEHGGIDLCAMRGWDIVVGDDATPAERYAAEEFREYLGRATGTWLPLPGSAQASTGHVLIGPEAAGRDAAAFGPEELFISVAEGRIAICGGRPRGTLYGVYTFLEDYLGVRFLTADHTYLPPQAERVVNSQIIAPLERTYSPPLSFRWPYFGENVVAPAFSTRLRINTVTDDPRLGGRTPMGLISHTFHRDLPSRVYGTDRPDYYALHSGRRLAPFPNDFATTQPCLANPDVLRIITQKVLGQIEADPTRRNVSVSQNDNAKHCQCDACRAVDEREGSAMGSVLAFVNAVADEVAQHHPDVKVGTLAYQRTRRPPKLIRPRPNVQVQLCSIECCVMHPIDDPACPLNVEFCRDLAEWGRVCDDLRVWHYNTNFSDYLLPCPNLRVIESNVRYFVQNNVRGLFVQVAGNERWAQLTPWEASAIASPEGNVLGAELCDLRNYVIANLLWDPSRSGQGLMDEFVDLHYAGAAPPIRRFIELVHDNAEAKGLHCNCFGRAADYGIDERVAREGLDAYAEALALAESDVVRTRVEKASMAAVRAALEPVWNAETAEDVGPDLAARMRPLARRLFGLCSRHGVTYASLHNTIGQVRRRLQATLGLPDV
ncbi:MAG: hypothetical protein AMK73_04325 [Planctomycetes bacterium SM23_32]|nr:MAG: hypothetical protein AMK73_04325 [Planctomycetes bacterium SM23_32]